MLQGPLLRFTPGVPPREPARERPEPAITPAEHDLILRYAIVGIFLMLALAALYAAKVIALPVVAGVTSGLVLGPVVDWLVRRGVPQHLAAAAIVIAGVVFATMAIGMLAAPVAMWSDQLPAMMLALQTKLSPIAALVRQIEEIAAAINPKGAGLTVSGGSPLFDLAISSSAAAAGVMIFLFTLYFHLVTRRHLKARVLRLCLGQEARKSAGGFFDDIEQRVATYLGVVTVVNAGIGVATMAIAWLAGLPYPIFWGALAFFLNYLAFVGPVIVAALLFAAGLLSENNTLFAAIWPAALYYGLHLLEGNWVTPTLVGNRLTVSPFLVFLSFIFWLWLWGPIGAVLSTPLLLIVMAAQETIADYRAAVNDAERATDEGATLEHLSRSAG